MSGSVGCRGYVVLHLRYSNGRTMVAAVNAVSVGCNGDGHWWVNGSLVGGRWVNLCNEVKRPESAIALAEEVARMLAQGNTGPLEIDAETV
ncbi:hypothetical protein [Desulfofundulus sp.]|uniref:hypothetical protein n=1 Tax=Desulfofundulus sp. TaxID=2282750 RepID=UPI003C74975F